MGALLAAALPRGLMDSRTWRNLRPSARALFVEIALGYDGKNDGRVRLSHREAAFAIHSGLATAVRAFAELEQAGLIRRSGRERVASRWTIVHLSNDAVGNAPKLKAA